MAGHAEQTPASAGQMRHLSLGSVAFNTQGWDAMRKNPDHDSLGGSRGMGSEPTRALMKRTLMRTKEIPANRRRTMISTHRRRKNGDV